ncbi:MAG TPA: CopD family protein [Gemmatimonadaceae bacterium]|nr:CopD family protein [Gemmatimonadaceae bacterium]
MRSLYLANVAVHILAAMFWLGGMFFLGVVGAPALRALDSAALRQRIFQQLGVRFRRAGWWAIAILLITGTLNLYFRGWLHWSVLGSANFWMTPVGHALASKLLGVAAMILVSSIHDFVLGPRAGRAAPGSPLAISLRTHAARLARLNALLGVVVVVAAVMLTRGG